jgi:hypothetical protein
MAKYGIADACIDNRFYGVLRYTNLYKAVPETERHLPALPSSSAPSQYPHS